MTTLMLAACGKTEVTPVASAEKEASVEVSVETPEVSASVEASVEENASEETPDFSDLVVRVGGLKGPTSIGLLSLKDKAAMESSVLNYEFTMETAADAITTALVKGELDIALIPANVASVLYNKTEGKISVIDINTLGVLYMVSADTSITTPKDLSGKTVYLTGMGTTPDYVLQYVLKNNGVLEDVTLEYKSEASEVAAVLSENPDAIGLLPQPFVTVACSKNESLSVVMNMQEQWDLLAGDSGVKLVTGVTVVRNDFLNEHEDAVKAFIMEHEASAKAANEEVDYVAGLAVANEIIGAEGVAKKAIPNCNITCIYGADMKTALSGYLSVLYDSNPASVGGNLPDEAFYFIAE